MSAPKPGDRVRVTETYEGVWTNRSGYGQGMWGVVAAKDFGVDFQVTNGAIVEVLASPVYVNHDTTEVWKDDVARLSYGRASGATVIYDGQEWRYGSGRTASRPQAGETLTLLVRDGQVVT